MFVVEFEILIFEIIHVMSKLIILYYLKFRKNRPYFLLQLEGKNGSSFLFISFAIPIYKVLNIGKVSRFSKVFDF